MNRITKYTSILALGLAMLLVAGNAHAAITLENISVARDGDSVVVTISTSEVAQFNAFTIDKKPERIVIDLDNVTNNIPQIDFANLPFKSIHKIRTSQFKIEPTLQARVVLNVGRALTYRTYRNGNDIVVKLPALADEVAFARWDATGENAKAKLANDNNAAKTAEPKPTAKVEIKPAAPQIAEKPVVEPKKEVASTAPQNSADKVEKPETKPMEKVEAKSQTEPPAQPAPKVDKPLAEPVKASAEPVKEKEVVSSPSVATPPAPAKQGQTVPTATTTETVDNNVNESPSDSAFADEPAAETANIDIEPNAKRKAVEYDPGDMKDPFTPLIGNGAGKLTQGMPSLENMKLVGILQDIELNRALLEDADGNGYMLKPNDKIRDGYLVSVTDNKAIFQVTEYGWTRTVALELEIPEIK
jgi:hypothetical protein